MQEIETYCQDLFARNQIDKNKFFDEKMFQDTVKVIEQYYKIDSKL